jgi:hypothetical protein
LENGVYDLVLLDLGLPKQDGLAVLHRYRRTGGNAAVIILTARDAVDARIQGLDAGADDYLVKPFDLAELAARVRAALRRRTGQRQPAYSHGELTLDPVAHEVTKIVGLSVMSVASGLGIFHTAHKEAGELFDYELRTVAMALPSSISSTGKIYSSELANPKVKGIADDLIIIAIWDLQGHLIYHSHDEPVCSQRSSGSTWDWNV